MKILKAIWHYPTLIIWLYGWTYLGGYTTWNNIGRPLMSLAKYETLFGLTHPQFYSIVFSLLGGWVIGAFIWLAPGKIAERIRFNNLNKQEVKHEVPQ